MQSLFVEPWQSPSTDQHFQACFVTIWIDVYNLLFFIYFFILNK